MHFYGTWSVIPEAFPKLPLLSAQDYVELALYLSDSRQSSRENDLRSLAARLGLAGKMAMNVGFFSDFEKCMLMLLMAAATAPEIIIAGHCTQCLDAL